MINQDDNGSIHSEKEEIAESQHINYSRLIVRDLCTRKKKK